MDKLLQIEEYRFEFDDRVVFGKLYKILKPSILSSDFSWEISHYYQTPSQATIYIPNGRYGNTIDQVREALFNYANGFKNVLKVTKNSSFN